MHQKRPVPTTKMPLINRLTSSIYIHLILFNYFNNSTYCYSTKSSIIKFPEDIAISTGTRLMGNSQNGGAIIRDNFTEEYYDPERNNKAADVKQEIEGFESFSEDVPVGVSRHGRAPLKGADGSFIRGEIDVQRVTFTQKGYIQFLKYILDVPTITEFTFCIWIRSYNLTYSHPLLSYSMHEEDRYIRAWISANGQEINLSLMEFEIFKIPVQLNEHHWYHICHSWDSPSGVWALYVNGKLRASGQEFKLQGLEIPAGGDIIVGQEYTDFDKGLDDGIEGDIYGFNFVLSPAISAIYRQWQVPATHNTAQTYYTVTPTPSHHPTYYQNEIDSISTDNRRNIVLFPPQRKYLYTMNKQAQQQYAPAYPPDTADVYSGLHTRSNVHNAAVGLRDEFPYKYQVHRDIGSVTQVPYIYNTGLPTEFTATSYEVPEVLSYFATLGMNRQPKGFMDFTGNILNRMLNNIFNQHPYNRQKIYQTNPTHNIERTGNINPSMNTNFNYQGGGNPSMKRIDAVRYSSGKTLGTALVELGYSNCALGKGSPVFGDKVLIAWMKTAVRVFGGAALHTERPFCVV